MRNNTIQHDAHVDDYLQVLDLVQLRKEDEDFTRYLEEAQHAADSYEVESPEWWEAVNFLHAVEQQEKLEQQEEACNRWL